MFYKRFLDERGQAVVEMALIAPVILMLLLGILEFGRMYNAYLTIDNATRSGARIGITGATDSEIANKIVSQTNALPNNSSITVSVTPSFAYRVKGEDLNVKTNYSFKFIAPLIGKLFNNNFTLTSNVTMRLE